MISSAIQLLLVNSDGVEPAGGFVYTYQWSTADNINGSNKVTLIGENLNTYTPTADQQGKFLGCNIQTTDDRGTIASTNDGRTY